MGQKAPLQAIGLNAKHWSVKEHVVKLGLKCGISLTITYMGNLYIYIYIYIYIYRLVQGKSSNPLKVLIKENKVIYQKYKSAKFGLVSYCH